MLVAMSSAVQSEVPLSVVLAAVHEDPSFHQAIKLHKRALEPLGGEVLVADGTDDGLEGVEPAVRMPGSDVFSLRAAAVVKARGQVIALTEDHVVPEDGWHEALLAAHKRHPELAVGGAVLNGSREKMIDRANFLMTFCTFLPPQPHRHPHRVSPPANLSYKRQVLDQYEIGQGTLEFDIGTEVFKSGQMVLDDDVRVSHVQSHGVRSTHAAHFHNGRTTGALSPRPVGTRARMRLALRRVRLPAWLVRTVVGESWNKPGYRRDLITSLPFVFTLAATHAIGEAIGVLFGPGDSPMHLE
jgi:hypothetical protein